MPLKPVSASFTIKWSVHDSWSELYVGIRRLVYAILPPDVASQTAEDSALCQLALVGASSLMEVALFKLLQPFAATGKAGLTQKKLENAGYADMLGILEEVTGTPLDRTVQPLRSTEALRKRRNQTIHKSSALATVPMARAALFSAVEGCRHTYSHAGLTFPYESFLVEYPIPHEPWFSDVPLPPAT
jgi:hypothetical protein